MSEAQLWQHLRACTAAHGVICRIENTIGIGTPDVCYALTHQASGKHGAGWIELKDRPTRPARTTTAIAAPGFTAYQLKWLINWADAGGRAFMLLRIRAPRSYSLISPAVCQLLYDKKLTYSALAVVSRVHSEQRFPAQEIIEALTE